MASTIKHCQKTFCNIGNKRTKFNLSLKGNLKRALCHIKISYLLILVIFNEINCQILPLIEKL